MNEDPLRNLKLRRDQNEMLYAIYASSAESFFD